MSDIVERETIEEQGLSDRPYFYENPSGNPLAETIGKNSNVDRDIVKLNQIIDFELTVPATAMFGSFGSGKKTIEHNIDDNFIPIVQIVFASGDTNSEVPLDSADFIFANASVNSFNFVVSAYNYTFSEITFDMRAFIYEVRLK